MKRLAALAQHITVLNLLLAVLLLALVFFVVEPLLFGSISIPLTAPKKAAEDKQAPSAARPRIVLPLEEVLVIADQNLYYQDAYNKYLFGPMFGVDLAAVELKKAEELAGEQHAAEKAAVPPLQDYLVIADQNLFHPERRIPPLKTEKEIPRPEFVLYGTLVSDDISIAYLGDKKAPRSTTGRGARQTSVQVGGVMSGYTLKEVLHDRVVMVRGDDRIEVRVIAPGGKKERGGTAASSPATSAPATSSTTPGAKPATASPMTPASRPAVTQPVSPTGPNPTDTRTKPSQFRRSFTPSSVGTR